MALRHFFQILGYLGEARRIAALDEAAVRDGGEEGARHASFHRRIVRVGGLFGIVGAGLGVLLIVCCVNEAAGKNKAGDLLFAPLGFGAIGVVSGVAVACLFAPRAFLTGPVGQKWMRLIGTRNVAVARVVCSIFTILLLAIIGFMGWAAWSDMQRGLR